MRLREIELENFKSFKGRISIPFGDGCTSITGPNGSGKSNITDAILFMMVPRTKALRAKRLNYLVYGHNPENRKTKCYKPIPEPYVLFSEFFPNFF